MEVAETLFYLYNTFDCLILQSLKTKNTNDICNNLSLSLSLSLSRRDFEVEAINPIRSYRENERNQRDIYV